MKPAFCPAFSLVEVVIALAIVSFAVLTLMALIPAGIGTFQQAQTDNVETQIVQDVNNELQNSPYTNLFDGTGNPQSGFTSFDGRTYDVEGEPIKASGTTATAGSTNTPVYTLSLSNSNLMVDGISSPLTNSAAVLAETVQILIAHHNTTNVFSTVVVNKGY
jgi:uncharacterized protein (TIGR02598 family)